MVAANRRDALVVNCLLRQCLDPTNATLTRLQTLGSSLQSVGTALAKNFWAQTVDFSLFPTVQLSRITYKGLVSPLFQTDNYQAFFLLRDPVVSHIIPTVRPLVAGAVPDCVYSALSVTTVNKGSGTGQINLGTGSRVAIPLDFQDATWVSGPKAYGEFIVSARNALSGSAFWIDAGLAAENASATVVLTFTEPANLTTSVLHFTATRLLADDAEEEVAAIIDHSLSQPHSISLTLQESGYYKFGIFMTNVGLSAVISDVKITITQRASYASVHYVQESYLNRSTVEGVRVLGASMLLSNICPEISKQGEIYAAVSPDSIPWFSYLGDMDKHVFRRSATGRAQFAWATGLYAIAKPQNRDSLELTDSAFSVDGVSLSAFRPFRDLGTVCALVERPAVSVAGSGSPAVTNLMVTRAIEFTTESQMYDTRPATMSTEAYEEFITALRSADCFYENPFHWSDIGNFIRRAANAVMTYGPYVLRGAEVAAAVMA